jgi:hypothetical protein
MRSETQITLETGSPDRDGRRWDVVAAVAAALLALGLVVVAGTISPAGGAPSRAVTVEAAP